MKITRVSPYTGKVNTMDLDVTEEEYIEWVSGKLIQDAMPQLTPEEREFIMSGMTPEDWVSMFNIDEEEDS